jgi:hypothetical protein
VGPCFFAAIVKFHDSNNAFAFVFSRESLRRVQGTERIGMHVLEPSTLEFHLICRRGQILSPLAINSSFRSTSDIARPSHDMDGIADHIGGSLLARQDFLA